MGPLTPPKQTVTLVARVERVYGFLRRPKWIALTITVVVLMVAMVNLGLWQLRRLDDRKATNALIRAAGATPAAPLDDVIPKTATFASVGDAQWRNVTAAGTYDVAREVLVANRSFNGLPGYHVLTPLQLADGRGVLVNRGWIPIAQKVGATVVVPPPPTGALTITGRVRTTQTRGVIGPRDATAGTLTVLARADVARVATQVPYPLVPAYLELTDPAGGAAAADAVPRLVPLQDLTEGPHLSYAVQWLIFTLCAAGGWIAVVRRQLRLDRQRAAKVVAQETSSAATR